MKINEIITIKNRKFEVLKSMGDQTGKKRKTSFWVGFFAIMLFAGIFILGFIAIRLLFPPMCASITIWTFAAMIGGYVAYMFIRSFLRMVAFVLSRNIKFKDLLFGVAIKEGAVYCVSKVPVSIAHMRLCLLLPVILVSLPLLAYSIAVGDIIFLIAAALSFTISAGDLWLLAALRKHKGSNFLLEDKAAQTSDAPGGHILKEIF